MNQQRGLGLKCLREFRAYAIALPVLKNKVPACTSLKTRHVIIIDSRSVLGTLIRVHKISRDSQLFGDDDVTRWGPLLPDTRALQKLGDHGTIKLWRAVPIDVNSASDVALVESSETEENDRLSSVFNSGRRSGSYAPRILFSGSAAALTWVNPRL